METGNKKLSFESAFIQQVIFQRKVEHLNDNHPIPYDSPVRFMYHMSAMTEELGEVLKADKRWKTHRNDTYNKAEKLDEIADCYITLMNISIWSGFNQEDIVEAISLKIDENNKRLEGKNSK